MITGEQAYLFRHALLRDAAYDLQLPGHRRSIHRLTLEIMLGISDARPELLDAWAPEMARHARAARLNAEPDLCAIEARCLRHAGEVAARRHRNEEAAWLYLLLADVPGTGTIERLEARLKAG